MDTITNLVSFINLLKGLILFILIPIASLIILFQGFSNWRQTRSWESALKSAESGIIFLVICIVAFSLTNMYDFIRSTDFGSSLPDLTTINKKK